MIDTIALVLGHALIAVALLRLAVRGAVDVDPTIAEMKAETRKGQQAASSAARNAARRARARDKRGAAPESA